MEPTTKISSSGVLDSLSSSHVPVSNDVCSATGLQKGQAIHKSTRMHWNESAQSPPDNLNLPRLCVHPFGKHILNRCNVPDSTPHPSCVYNSKKFMDPPPSTLRTLVQERQISHPCGRTTDPKQQLHKSANGFSPTVSSSGISLFT